jgi:hypothetical protein
VTFLGTWASIGPLETMASRLTIGFTIYLGSLIYTPIVRCPQNPLRALGLPGRRKGSLGDLRKHQRRFLLAP